MSHKLRINGKEVTREEFMKKRFGGSGVPAIAQGYSEGNPGHSIAMSVHPSQCAMMNETLRAHGITGVHYDPSKKHNCVITSRKDRARAMRVIGQTFGHGPLHDNDGGFGDG